MAPTSVNVELLNCGLTYCLKQNNFPSNSLGNSLKVPSLDSQDVKETVTLNSVK